MTDLNDSFDFLDSTVDDLADLPEFKPYPLGSYIFTFAGWDTLFNDKKKPTGVELEFSLRSVLEMADPEEMATFNAEEGRKWKTRILVKKKDGGRNEFGEGQLKNFLNVLRERFPGESTREILDGGVGSDLAITLKQRADKNDREKIYNEIKEVAFAD